MDDNIKIFYARSTHNEYIHTLAEEIKKILSEDVSLDICDPENGYGTFKIDDNIFKQIDECDLFIVDITPDEYKSNNKFNPNVVFEFGYAFKTVNKENILILCESTIINNDKKILPFDFGTYRMLEYDSDIDVKKNALALCDHEIKNHIDKLKGIHNKNINEHENKLKINVKQILDYILKMNINNHNVNNHIININNIIKNIETFGHKKLNKEQLNNSFISLFELEDSYEINIWSKIKILVSFINDMIDKINKIYSEINHNESINIIKLPDNEYYLSNYFNKYGQISNSGYSWEELRNMSTSELKIIVENWNRYNEPQYLKQYSRKK